MSVTNIFYVIILWSNVVLVSKAGNTNNELSRYKRAVIHKNDQLFYEPFCPQVKNLCSDLRFGYDDLYVLECIQTFQASQIESLSDECQNAIWAHTTNLMADGSVLKLTQKNCSAGNCKIL